MLLMRKPCTLSGSKYFQRELLLDDDDSDNEECDEGEHQLNSATTASCTVSTKQDGNKTKTKNKVGASHIKLQNNLPIANSDITTYNTSLRHDDDDNHMTRQTSFNHSTTQSHDNTTRQLPPLRLYKTFVSTERTLEPRHVWTRPLDCTHPLIHTYI